MEKIISIFLTSEEDAFKASQEINQLVKDGDITVRELYIISKKSNGEVQIRNAKNEQLPYSASGAFAGGFIGILGGPLGILFGMTTGLLAGSIGDLIRSSKSSRFVEKASRSIPTGKTAIIANINEYWEAPLNTVIKPFNAEITRLNVNEEIEKFVTEEQRELNGEIVKLTNELEQATEAEKAKINAQLEELKTRKKLFSHEIIEKVDEEKDSLGKWFEKVKNNFSNWTADISDRFDDSKEDLVDDYKDLKEDFAELEVKIKRGLRILSNTTEESFRKSVNYIKEEIRDLDEDILELRKEVDRLADKDKSRWQTKLDKLDIKRNDLVAKARDEYNVHKKQYQEWLAETGSVLEKDV